MPARTPHVTEKGYSGSQKSEVCPMPTEAYALCPRRPMPMSTSSFARKAIYMSPYFLELV